MSRRDWQEGELYHAGGGNRLQVEDDLSANLLLKDGYLVSAAVMRDSRTFREEDREIFALLLPHMVALFSPLPAPESASLGGLGLTRREQDVLFWISEEKRNSEIAQILGISRETVKRHLENLYAKLSVENRRRARKLSLRISEQLPRFLRSLPGFLNPKNQRARLV